MTTTSSIPNATQLTDEDVRQVTSDVFNVLLHLEVEPLEQPVGASETEHFAVVGVTGGWHGLIVLGLNNELARHAAGVIFGRSASSPTSDDVSDALCELANMIGGNLKPLLPGPSRLLIPEVLGRDALDAAIHGKHEVYRASFLCRGEPLNIRVLAAVE